MTDHSTLEIRKGYCEVADPVLQEEILKLTSVCNVALNDEPYPYVVPMNYGYEWNDKLVFYMHMARAGHRVDLLRQDNRVSLTVFDFLDRVGYKRYKKEPHDYRSVFVYGHADILDPHEQPEEFLHAIQTLCNHTGRYGIKAITKEMYDKLYMLQVTADIVRGKAQYTITTPEEVPIPPLEK